METPKSEKKKRKKKRKSENLASKFQEACSVKEPEISLPQSVFRIAPRSIVGGVASRSQLYQDNTIQMNASAMIKNNFCCGECVILSSWSPAPDLETPEINSFNTVGVVYPTNDLTADCVMLGRDLKSSLRSDDNFVNIVNLPYPPPDAIEITLDIPIDSPETFQGRLSSSLLQSAASFLNGHVIIVDSNVRFPFLGRQISCRVASARIHETPPTPSLKNAMSKEEEKMNPNLTTIVCCARLTTKYSAYADPSADKKIREVSDENNNDTQGTEFDNIGGLDKQIALVKDIVQTPLLRSDVFESCGVVPPRGVLLYGPPGTGKTLVAHAVAQHCGVHVVVVPIGIEIQNTTMEDTLRRSFQEAKDNSPSVVVIDEIDALGGSRENSSEYERRIVSTLLSLLDGAVEMKGVVLIATTSRPHALDPALRRPGRLDREIEIGVPNEAARCEILKCLVKGIPHALTDEHFFQIAAKCHGFVGSDLLGLTHEARISMYRRALKTPVLLDGGVSSEITLVDDFMDGLSRVKPSVMREVLIEVPHVKWSDVGGQHSVKQKLREAVEWPLTHPEAFERLGIRPPRGILLYGPPGCSKTLMAKALATESGLNFIAIKGPELFSKWVGESERAMRKVFQRARSAMPSVVFLDEIDALASKRGGQESSGVHDRVLSQLLIEMDGVESLENVVVIAATNRPDMIDPALLRPGRFDRVLYVGMPDMEARNEIFDIQLHKIPHSDDVSADTLASQTQGYSGAECVAVCREAVMQALDMDIDVAMLTLEHFEKALTVVTPRTSSLILAFYDSFRRNAGAAEL